MISPRRLHSLRGRSSRADGIQTAQVKCEILTKPAKDSLREDLEADGLGNRLLHDRQSP